MPPTACPAPRSRGYTLLELLVALGVAALLATAASAGWGSLTSQLRLALGSSRVRAALAEARLAALGGGETVRVEPRAGGTVLGIIAGDGGGARTLREVVLPRGLTAHANRPAVSYYPWPRAASPVTVTLCTGGRAQRLVVSQAGRVRSEAGGRC